jgi:hypothetical protein
LVEVATMGKPRLELVDQTFDVAFEAMRDNDARRPLFTEAEVDEFIEGLIDECFAPAKTG